MNSDRVRSSSGAAAISSLSNETHLQSSELKNRR
jgi:hypothetical protein